MMSTHIDTVSNREELQHFSHDHPLIYTEEENPGKLCSACGLPLMSTPSYKCSKDCKFFLHQPCTELPQSFERYFHQLERKFVLLAKPPRDNCNCQKCGKLCENFTYESSGDTLYIHCICAFPLEINIEHFSHREHSLTAMRKEASLACDACGREQNGNFFCCLKCSFYIHQDCCLLPNIVWLSHTHLLSISYTLSEFPFLHKNCLICNGDISLSFGAYICEYCRLGAHLYCATTTAEPIETINDAVVHLPSMPDMFVSRIIKLVTRNNDNEVGDVNSKIEKYHNDHSSWMGRHHQESDTQLVCNSCIQPIASPHLSHYSCPQPKCDFLLHQFCANLSPFLTGYFDDDEQDFFSKSNGFCSVFDCFMCKGKCNGFGYKTDEYSIDVRCTITPVIIKHESHSQHRLIVTIKSNNSRLHVCCDRNFHPDLIVPDYHCSICDDNIHVRCALLPKTAKYKFDEHPLDLIYNPTIQIPHEEDKGKETHYFCEFCEEDVNPKFWFYYCGKCDQSFHVRCIPSTGELSMIKFGRNIDLPGHVHDHPVTLTRMLTIGSQRCGDCKDMIQGFVDEMSFLCSKCDFWIHFDCAEEITSQENGS